MEILSCRVVAAGSCILRFLFCILLFAVCFLLVAFGILHFAFCILFVLFGLCMLRFAFRIVVFECCILFLSILFFSVWLLFSALLASLRVLEDRHVVH